MTHILLFGQVVAGYSVAQIAIIAIIICAVVGIAIVVIRQTGVAIPGFFITILWIVLAAFLGIMCIKLLMSVV